MKFATQIFRNIPAKAVTITHHENQTMINIYRLRNILRKKLLPRKQNCFPRKQNIFVEDVTFVQVTKLIMPDTMRR